MIQLILLLESPRLISLMIGPPHQNPSKNLYVRVIFKIFRIFMYKINKGAYGTAWQLDEKHITLP